MLNGSNMYAYCDGNPVMFVDPSGRGKVWNWVKKNVVDPVVNALSGVGDFIANACLSISKGLHSFADMLGTVQLGITAFVKTLEFGSPLLNLFSGFFPDPTTVTNPLLKGILTVIDVLPSLNNLVIAACNVMIRVGNIMIDAANNLSASFFNMAIRINGGSTSQLLPIDAEGYMLLNQEGEMVGVSVNSSMQGGGASMLANTDPAQYFELKVGANITQANLFHNASGSNTGLKSAELTVNLSAYPGTSVEDWRMTGSGTGNITLTTTTGSQNTVTANNGTANVELVAYVNNRSGNSIGTARIRLVSIEMVNTINIVQVLPDTFAGPLPQRYPSPVPERVGLVSVWSYPHIGNYGDYILLEVSYMGSGPRYVFAEKARLDLYTPIATELAPILYGSASGTNIDKAKKLVDAGEKHNFTQMAICTDGIDYGWGHGPSHQDGTFAEKTSMPMYANPFQIRYAVLPESFGTYSQRQAYMGNIAILIDNANNNYVITIIAESGNPNVYSEFSFAAAWDLVGEKRKTVNGLAGPSGNYSVIYLPGTNSLYGYSGLSWGQISQKFGWNAYSTYNFGDKVYCYPLASCTHMY